MADGRVVIQVDMNGDRAQSGISKLRGLLGGLSDTGTKVGSVFKSVLGANLISGALMSGIEALTGSIKGAFSTVISEGAALQQSLGGVETLFKGSADKVKAYADEAFRTAGLSANAYMENVTSFSASLLQSLGGDTEKAAEVANRAMIDMSDNANKMGTDIGRIQDAYQGFAKDNYTMLDNLKLGYGGTKTEMQRLIKDAAAMKNIQEELNVSVEDGNMSFGNIVNAISVMQKKLEITGTTAKEASSTLSGSFASMKAAWQSLAGKLALGMDIGPSLKNLVSTTSTFLLGNFIPMVGNIMKQLPQAISGAIAEAGPQIENSFKTLFSSFGVDPSIFNSIKDTFRDVVVTVETVFATLTNKANGFNNVISGVGNIVKLVNFVIQDLARAIQFALEAFAETGAINNAYKAFKDLTEAALDLAMKLSDVIPWDVVGAAAGHLVNAISTIISWISKLSQSISKDVWSGLITGIGGGVLAFKAFNFLKSFNPFNMFKKNADEAVDGVGQSAGRAKSTITQLFNGISNVIKSSGTAIKAAATGIGQGIKTALSGVAPVIKAFGAALKTAGVGNILAFGGAVAIAAVGIGAGVAIIAAGFALLATQSKGISEIIGAVGQAFSAFATAIIGAFAQAIVTVAGVLPTVTSALAGLSPLVVAVGQAIAAASPFVTALGEAFTSIISVLPPVITALSEGVAAIISALTPIVEIVGNVFTNIAQIVADAIVKIVQSLAPFMPAVSEMVQALAPVLQSIVEAFTTLVSQISPIIDSIANLFKSLGESIKTVLDGAKGVIESFGGAVRNILDGISGIFDAIGNAALNAGKGFKLMAEGVVMITKTNLGDMAASLAAVATGIGAIAANGAGIATAGNGMKALGQGMAMVQAYSAGASVALSTVAATIPALSSGFSALAPVIASAMARAVTSVQSGMLVIVTVIRSSAAQMTAAGLQAGQGVSRGVTNGIRSGVGQATSAMNTLILSVQRVGNIGARNMVNIGTQIGNGLARGMIAALPAVTSAANALVDQAERAAKARADINSPSRLFRDQVGRYIAQGIAVGIEQNTSDVVDSLDKVQQEMMRYSFHPEKMISQSAGSITSQVQLKSASDRLQGGQNKSVKDKADEFLRKALEVAEEAVKRPVYTVLDDGTLVAKTGEKFKNWQDNQNFIRNRMRGVEI
jgi:phage-related protein